MACKDDDGFDLIQPSLIQQLRTILDQYPDDGQILKELIQNAEDANASRVKLLHDKHSHDAEQLFDEDLAQFQGPALYAYNNARFTKEDWTGIRLVCDSIKVDDPMKVGRFGLGFKSVFHMTDLPSLLSDCQIGFIDPHGIHFSDKRHRRTGKHWKLNEDRAEMEEIPDQFVPYKGIFDCTEDVFSQGFYDGTLFRFPFRTKPSELSATLYSAEKMDTLFDSFEADAHLVLLFLQHLESIELYVREESESDPERVFQVKIADQCLQIVRAKRKEFLAKITPGKVMTESVTVTYPVTIETDDGTVKQHSFLVTNYFCGGEVSARFKKLMTDKELNYLPTVGVAMALPTGPKEETPDIKGHVFCFLPLPVQKRSLTGLPVHVNGFFALSQNRCYIKSPNADQEDRERSGRQLTDKSLLWNRCLLEEAIPRAYATIILEAINGKSLFVPRTSIFKAWPDISSIDPKWEKIRDPLFHLLLQEEVVYTPAKLGQWLTMQKAVFDLLSKDEPKELLQQVLQAADVPVVSVPSHVTDAILCYAGATVKKITPSGTRAALKQVPSCYQKLDRRDKLLLLQFCLKDRKYDKLCGLMLLPLFNGAFTYFSDQGKQIYICSLNHPRELFPGLEHRFIDHTVNGDIIGKLKDAANQEVTQLRLLRADHVPSLLCEALPSEWKKGNAVLWYPKESSHNHPPIDWIEVVWRYLQEHFRTEEDIQSLGKLPLIPLSMSQTPVTLVRLCRPSKVVVKCLNDDSLDDTLTNVLKTLGLIIMNEFPTYVRNHAAILGTFVHPPSAEGVLKAMVNSSGRMAAGMFSEIMRTMLSTKDKQLLRSFLARVRPSYVGQAEYNLLCTLPIFQTLSKTFVSKNGGLCAAVAGSFPVLPLRELIDITQHDSKTLAVLLDIKILTPTELLCQIVFPDIQRGKYSEDQIDKIMTYVLENHASEIRKNVTFKQKLQALPFVSKQRGRATASDLFNPREVILKNLFVNEDVFPTVPYNERSVLVMLEELGMKSEDNITGYDLYQSAKLVSGLTYLPTAKRKSRAVLEFLRDNPKTLSESVYGQPLGSLLKDIPWVSRLQERPPNYPPGLTWFEAGEENGKHFFKPTEVKSQYLANLIGTVLPLVEVEPSNQISKYFGWQYLPGVFQVIQQLQNVIRSYSKEEKPLFMVVLNEIYLVLSRLLAMDVDLKCAFDRLEEFDWVWNGNGFSSPSHVLFREPHIDLTPYIRSLPPDMSKYAELFYRFGMRERSNPVVLVQVLHMIKEKYDDGIALSSDLEVRRDLHLSINIVNELASEQLSEDLQAQIVLPTHTEDNSRVRLEPVECCMYCHHDWLKLEGDDDDIDYFYVHPNVPNSTAERLGVPSLTNRMLDPDELFIGEEFGQEERLTTRLNRLLEEYTDGFSVLKELVQNADDAGATEVRFLYDERTNVDAMTCLIDEGMKGCQGPALWVYNDAEFQDEDFENIAKLNEATKEHKTDKIGRFGLGFNAVYNLTDVPMLLSRNYFVIFDPHTSYLGKAIKNKRKPGMKIDLNKDVKRLRRFTNQFKPFNGIFGCDLHLDKEDNSFHGTLFRFALRTSEQAERSEIKKLPYDDQQMRELLLMLVNGAKTLLLFTQNVLHVSVYSLKSSHSEDQKAALLFEVSKSLAPGGIVRSLSVPVNLPDTTKKLASPEKDFLKQCSFLQASSQITRNFRKGVPTKLIKSAMKVNIKCSFTEYGLSFFACAIPFQKACSTWLVASSMGNGQALKFAKDDSSLLPSAGVAVQLVPNTSGTIMPLPVKKTVDGLDVNGILFCYLPLPIHSGLPIHINGAFALAANRRHLQEKLEDDKQYYGVSWNNVLMQDSIASAYLCLLEDLKSIASVDGSYKFHSLWPKACDTHHNCWPVIKSFYTQVAKGNYSLFSDGERWLSIDQIAFLDPDFRKEIIGDISVTVFQLLMKGTAVVVDVPVDVLKSFQFCGLEEVLNPKIYDKDRFFRELFFPKISTVPPELRDPLVLHALDINCNELIRTHACIPVSGPGNSLKYPSQLIHPDKDAAHLFLPSDGRFPRGNKDTFLHSQRLAKLETLGMVSDFLPWQEVAERAESIQALNAVSSDAACERTMELLQFMEKKMKYEDKIPSNSVIGRRILEANFLPVLKKPASFPLRWKGDEFGSKVLLAPKDVFLEDRKYLLCCTEPLVGVYIPGNVKPLLRLNKKHATLAHVITQLEVAVSTKAESPEFTAHEEISRLCYAAYSYLDTALADNSKAINKLFKGKSFILNGRQFLSATQVAFNLKVDCSPYLYQLPEPLAQAFPKLMKIVGVRDHFEEKDFISSLLKMKSRYAETELDQENLQTAVHLANKLGEALRDSRCDPSEVEEKCGIVYIPDSRGVLRPVSELCIKDCPWMPDEPDVHFVNTRIPWPTCDYVGVKTRIEEALRSHVVGIPFGQREKLTSRLERILTCYPSKKDILKELLQNADDAKATEICFIKDPRDHPKEKVFKDSWQPLQGPALCVYNNKPFTNADIEGIRNLGEGSKGDDPNKTGQYGVGFNAVYHLTDAPSFISKGEEIGDVLCVFDPHCKFAPGANSEEPGRMFKVSPTLQRRFPDVFPCYLWQHFPRDNATMFRFPLRTPRMALESKISPKSVSVDMLDTMMGELKKELFEVLLFLNNVKKITLCEINTTSGDLENAYTVQAVMSEEDEVKRQAFASYIKEIGRLLKEEKALPTNIQVARVSYVLNITDTLGNQEKWLIVQQLGFEKTVKASIVNAFKKHQLGMLPRGGVACLLEKQPVEESHVQTRKKPYCFLPLPFETNLPVHINGHFALDHESRRNLWRDETGGYRSDWNNALLQDVIASCYITLLVEVRNFLKLPNTQDANSCTEDEILSKIKLYETFFPRQPPSDQYWKALVDSVYKEINRKELKMLPVVRNSHFGVTRKTAKGSTVVQVSWLPPTSSGKKQVFFNNLAKEGPFVLSHDKKTNEFQTKIRKRFEAILLESGFNLVAFSLSLHESFRRAGVTTCCISPNSVMDFYRTLSSQNPLCTIGPIPCHVDETTLKDVPGVIMVLQYCKGAAGFFDKLEGLPLLLTQDNRLQLFSSEEPKFLSRYQDILPGSPHIFLHEDVYRKIFKDVTENLSVLKPLDVKAFAANLPQTLHQEHFGYTEFVKWCPTQKAPPNQPWIYRVWVFLHGVVRDVVDDVQMDEQTKILEIKRRLEPLSSWSILPATEPKSTEKRTSLLSFLHFSATPPTEHFLVPLGKAASVLEFRSADSSSEELVDVLRKLGLPELNSIALSTTGSGAYAYSSPNSVSLARIIVASLKVPASLLTSFHQKMDLDPQSLRERLAPSDCITILEYFSKSVKCLRDPDRTILRRLPFYEAKHGGLIGLNDRKVCVVLNEIPQNGIDVLERELKVVFLKSRGSLYELFKFLGLECVSTVDMYCTCILTNFSILSDDARQVHLEFIRKYLDGLDDDEGDDEDGDQRRLLECLRNTPLVPSADGTLKTASCFCDRTIDVFKIMLSESMFPPKPLDSPEWLKFLRRIGLVHEVTKDSFKRFAVEVAHEAASAPSDNTYKKSKVLVNHLMHRHNVVAEGLLQSICDIRFVAGDPVREPLQALSPPFGGVLGSQGPFFAFKGAVPSVHAEIVWTKAYLLPRWADPRWELKNHSRNKYCDALVAQLQILEKPPVDLVVGHCQNICLHLANNSENTLVGRCYTIKAVMESIYTFLQAKKIANTDAKNALENTPCILVEDGKKLILPCQAVLELYEHLEIKPFLYGIPKEFGKFHRLFEDLGCSKCVTISHYAMVLDRLQKKCQKSKLHPNEVRMCVKATKGFFERLEENAKEVESFSALYLPGMSLTGSSAEGIQTVTPVSLHKSSDLIFNDAPTLRDRLHKFYQPFLLDLHLMDVACSSAQTNYKELTMKLPTPLQPKMLSLVVKEKLSASQTHESVMTNAVSQLKHHLSSSQFCSGVIRLIRDENCREKRVIDDCVIENIERGLRRIELLVVNNLKTTLFADGVSIPESEAEVAHFLDKVLVSSEEIWRVYVAAVKGVDESTCAIWLVSNVIEDICGGLLGRRAIFIPEMLRCPLSDIWSLLDVMGVRQDDSSRPAEEEIYPPPGTFIPIEDHHLLNDAFEEFEPGEYVGYELEDPSLQRQEGNATYIYAVIIDIITNEDCNPLTKHYRINIGDAQEIVVDAADLYKFHRLNTATSSEIVLSDHRGEPPRTRSRQEVFDEISNLLEDAWKLPEERRKKIIKRLYLRWHPDKNLGDEEFCTEVCQHIQNETFRLERGEPRGSRRSNAESRTSGGSYDDLFTSWGYRAKEHNTQRQGYRTRQQFPRNTHRKNPQPGEARRWFRQSKADIAAVENDIVCDNPSYEWACFKCHQAAEKALKAAQYTIDADKTNVHNLGQNCNGLNDSELTELACQLENLVGDSTRMRYPDRVHFPQIPNDVYSDQTALQALQLAKKIVERVQYRIS